MKALGSLWLGEENMTKYIKLTKGLQTLVDDEDYARLSKHKWYASGVSGREYAARRMKDHEEAPRKMVLMHREILGIGFICSDEHVDHLNGDRLDNRRSNLKEGTCAQNLQNSTTARNQTGVGYDATHDRFKAYVNIPEKYKTRRINVGTFRTRAEAVAARETFISKMKEGA